MNKINLLEKFSLFNEHWTPKIIAELNGQQVKLAKIQGEFIWHNHEEEDELFLVVKGNMTIELRDKTVEIGENEIYVVPRGVEHKPVAKEETWILMFEPASTRNTGNEINERSKHKLEHI
jgi:mannose-6-phosphate isomerase-like protein (cupin superfamily)